MIENRACFLYNCCLDEKARSISNYNQFSRIFDYKFRLKGLIVKSTHKSFSMDVASRHFSTSVMFKLHKQVDFKFRGIAMKTLVVYYSRTGKTRFVAEKVASELKADIEEIVDLKNRSGRFGFLRAGYDATRGNETEIGEMQKSPSDFELIVVGTPVWNSRPASAISAYLKRIDFAGKKVAVFFTNEGMGEEKSVERTKALISNGDVVGELVVSKVFENQEENESKISDWCRNLSSL
jgi:flavodoxin